MSDRAPLKLIPRIMRNLPLSISSILCHVVEAILGAAGPVYELGKEHPRWQVGQH